ncbi:LuxR C-terminal-related transcriptional regulator [Streptomyces sp. NPDC001070]
MSDHDLTPQDIGVYRHLLQVSPDADRCASELGLLSDEFDESVKRLMTHRLLHPDGPCRYEVVSPGLAAAELTASLNVQVHQLLRQIDTTRRDLGPLGTLYEAHQRQRLAGTTTELLTDGDAVRHRLADLSTQVRHSVLTAHPTLGGPQTLRAALDLDRDLLDRGVRYRTVVPHTARRQREALQHMTLLGDLGAQLRTAAVIPGRMILLDGVVALVSTGKGGGAALFRDPTVVSFLEVIFDHIWEHAKPVGGGDFDGDVFEDVEVAILRQLELGRSDEFISRRLGISTRTLRRYLSGMCEKLGVETRFQLGVAAARLDLFGNGDDPGSAG